MGKIYYLKTPIATIEFTLDYDTAKDKYYLTVCAYGDLWTETFYGDWALKEYLRTDWNFTESQIIELMEGVYDTETRAQTLKRSKRYIAECKRVKKQNKEVQQVVKSSYL